MSSTNRALNRLFLIVVGCLLLAAGLAAVGLWAVPAGRSAVRDDLVAAVDRFLERLPTWQTNLMGLDAVPWVLLLVPAAALVLVVLLCVFVFAQGRGRTRDVVRERSTDDTVPGSLEVDVNIASAVIGDELDGRSDSVGAHVSAYRVKGVPAVKVTVTPRKGADVERLVEDAVRVVEGWDRLLGRRVPVLLHLTRGSWSGLRRPSGVE